MRWISRAMARRACTWPNPATTILWYSILCCRSWMGQVCWNDTRKKWATPRRVLVLTARDEKENVVRLLNAGIPTTTFPSRFDLGEFPGARQGAGAPGKGPKVASAYGGHDSLQLNTIERTVRRGQRRDARSCPWNTAFWNTWRTGSAPWSQRRSCSNTSTTTTGRNSAT